MAESNSKEYDCLLIYNDESYQPTRNMGEDNSLFVSCVTFVDEMLKNHGLITHHHDRDSIPGTHRLRELARVVESSQVVLLILDKYFLENSWMNFCKDMTLVKLIDESPSPACPGSNRLIPILINVAENDIPIEIKAFERIHVMNESDMKNERKWLRLKNAIERHFRDKLNPSAPMQHNNRRFPETPDTLTVPSDSRFNPVGNDTSSRATVLPFPNSINTSLDSFYTGSLPSQQSNDNISSLQQHQERKSRTPPTTSTTSSVGMQETSMHGSSLSNYEPSVTEPITTLRSTDLEIDARQSMQPVEAAAVQISTGHFQDHTSSRSSKCSVSDSGIEQSSGIQITETVSFDHCPVMDHETIPSSLNQSYALVSSSIQEDAIVNQNLEASLEAHGGGLGQQESLDTLAAPLNESPSSTSRRSLNRPIVAVQPYISENTNSDNDRPTSMETMYFSNTLPDNIDSLR